MQTTTQTPVKTNDLRHTIRLINMDIEIRLNDECKNGHNDFAITATLWTPGKPHIDKYCVGGGCCHDEILKVRPKLKIFVDLHLSDASGVPMYVIENGFFHLKDERTDPAKRLSIVKEYLRATDEDMTEIVKAKDQTHFAFILMKLDFLNRWKKEAQTAIKMLEEMTGKKFKDDSKRSQWNAPSAKDLKEIEKRLKSDYYTPERAAERVHEKAEIKRAEQIKEVIDARNKEVKKAQDECSVKLAVLAAGGDLDNFIYYNHTNEGAFNWKNYEKPVTAEQFDAFMKKVDLSTLPEGITFKLNK